MGGWLAYNWSRPNYWDYGNGGYVQYRDNVVYVDKQEVSTQDYYDQAESLATTVPQVNDDQADKVEWLPLGVFAYVTKGVPDTNSYLQLAVTKDGTIGGTYFNQATDISRALQGTVDKKTQRAAWTFADGKNTDIVMETGIYNLTKDEVPVLLHLGSGKRQEGTLIRVPEPKEEAEPSTKPSTASADPDEKARQWYQLAENFSSNGMKDKATEHAEKIIETYPKSKWAKKARKFLPKKVTSKNETASP